MSLLTLNMSFLYLFSTHFCILPISNLVIWISNLFYFVQACALYSWSLLCIFSSVFCAALDKAILHIKKTCYTFSSKPLSKCGPNEHKNLGYLSAECYIMSWVTSELVLLCMCSGELSSSMEQRWCRFGLFFSIICRRGVKTGLRSAKHRKAKTHLRSFISWTGAKQECWCWIRVHVCL